MGWISSQELAELLKLKTPIIAIKWAKKERINYLRKGAGYLGRYWFNEKEVSAKLKEMRQCVNAGEAAAILGKHRATLRRWAKQGGLKPAGRGSRNTPLFKKSNILRLKPKTRSWVLWQKKVLVKCYQQKLFSATIAKKLGKSPTAVKSKAYQLGLTKIYYRDFYYLKDVAEFLGASRYRVSRWIKSGKLSARPIISLGRRIKYRISEEEIARFLALYPQSWQGLKPLINLLELPSYTKLNRKNP